MPSRYRYLNGYRTKYEPNHPKAMSGSGYGGYVYEHVLVAEENLGRPLLEQEEVHHLDGVRDNNAPHNVIVLSKSEHSRLHRWLSKVEVVYRNPLESKKCPVCGGGVKNPRATCCSVACRAAKQRKVERPSKTELEEDIASMSWLAVGRKYGVSDNAVRKWAMGYGLL